MLLIQIMQLGAITTECSTHAGLPRARPWPDKGELVAEDRVPSLIRFLLGLGILAGLVFAGMIALVTFVEPEQREISQTIPPARLNK